MIRCGASPRGTAWLGRIVDKPTAEFAERLTLDELSGEAGVHRVHLSRVFRKWKGEGIGEYVHRLRIRAACEQMLVPEIPISEIGLATGFADQSHFTRSFRKVTGMTPAAFRSQVTGDRSQTKIHSGHSDAPQPAARSHNRIAGG